MADTCALEGIDITKSFGGFSALKDVGIRVAGEIRVIGPNGAGKSTLMDVLSGRARHWTGNVRMSGRDISASSVQQRRRADLLARFSVRISSRISRSSISSRSPPARPASERR